MTATSWLQDPAPPVLHLSLANPVTRGLERGRRDALQALVQPGQTVLKGQLIASGALPLHASTSGRIVAVKDFPAATPGGSMTPHLVLEVDGDDRWIEHPVRLQHVPLKPETFIERVRHAGLCGLGGGGYPTHRKLAAAALWTKRHGALTAVVINAIECEPSMTADDFLMRSKPDEILEGIDLLMQLFQPLQTILAMGEAKTQACKVIEDRLLQTDRRPSNRATHSARLHLQTLSEEAAMGSEYRLLPALNLHFLPNDRHDKRRLERCHPTAVGILCLNVATVYAIYRAIRQHEPLLERLVSLAGDTPRQRVMLVPNGLPVAALLDSAAEGSKLYLNGPLSGWPVSPQASFDKASLGIFVRRDTPTIYPCIRCDRCREVCPVRLDPQLLHWSARRNTLPQLLALGLEECIECGLCDEACPSHIPLLAQFRDQKEHALTTRQRQLAAEVAKQRYRRRQDRLAKAVRLGKGKRAQRLQRLAKGKNAGASE